MTAMRGGAGFVFKRCRSSGIPCAKRRGIPRPANDVRKETSKRRKQTMRHVARPQPSPQKMLL